MSSPLAIVTGASRGIGKRLCVDLAHAGYDVVCTARTSNENRARLPGTVDETADLVRAKGRRALTVALDVRDEEGVAALAERVADQFGRCDLLINNAAFAPPRPALQDTTKKWRIAVDVNLNGPFYFVYYFWPHLAKAPDGGRMIHVSSAAAYAPTFGRASYTATKRGLEGLSDSLAHDLEGQVASNTVRIDIPLWTEGFDDTLQDGGGYEFEDPVLMSDAVLWLARQPLSHTGRIHTLTGLREQGVLRPRTPYQKKG